MFPKEGGSISKALSILGVEVDWNFFLTFGALVMTRLAMATSLMPFLVGKPVPGQIRVGFSLVMAVFLYPMLAPKDPTLLTAQGPLWIMLLFLKEAFYGVCLGFMSSVIFYAFEAAGSMVDNQRGAAQARLLIPQLGTQTSIFGNFSFLLGIVLFISLDGHLLFLKALIESYQTLPILALPDFQTDFLMMTREFVKMTGLVLVYALQLTAPILISIFVSDVILGIMSKTAPSINVWELGFVIRGVLGVLIFYLAIEIVSHEMTDLSINMVEWIQKVVRILSWHS